MVCLHVWGTNVGIVREFYGLTLKNSIDLFEINLSFVICYYQETFMK